jgi:hypothetical protein
MSHISNLFKMRGLFDKPMNPSDSSLLRLRRRDEGVASDEHAKAERNKLDSGRRGRSLARDEI